MTHKRQPRVFPSGLRRVPQEKLAEFCSAMMQEERASEKFTVYSMFNSKRKRRPAIFAEDGTEYTSGEVRESFMRALKPARAMKGLSIRAACVVVHDYVKFNECVDLHREYEDYPKECLAYAPTTSFNIFLKERLNSMNSEEEYEQLKVDTDLV